MVATAKFNEAVNRKGLKKSFIADSLGISRYSLMNKTTNKTEFKASEIAKLVEILALSNSDVNEIFFA